MDDPIGAQQENRLMVKPLKEIQDAGARFAMHLNMGSAGHTMGYTAIADDRLGIRKGWRKARGEKKKTWFREFVVAGCPEPFLTIEEAWEALRKIDQQATDEAEWNAAAPKKPKPAYIPGWTDHDHNS